MRGGWQLVEAESGRMIIPRLDLAVSFLERLAGLQFRSSLPVDRGLLIAPCNGIHTCWMRFAIDCFYLDSSGQVLEVRRNVRPWRVCGRVQGGAAILEVATGVIELAAGTQVCLRAVEGKSLAIPRSLNGMACPASIPSPE